MREERRKGQAQGGLQTDKTKRCSRLREAQGARGPWVWHLLRFLNTAGRRTKVEPSELTSSCTPEATVPAWFQLLRRLGPYESYQ